MTPSTAAEQQRCAVTLDGAGGPAAPVSIRPPRLPAVRSALEDQPDAEWVGVDDERVRASDVRDESWRQFPDLRICRSKITLRIKFYVASAFCEETFPRFSYDAASAISSGTNEFGLQNVAVLWPSRQRPSRSLRSPGHDPRKSRR